MRKTFLSGICISIGGAAYISVGGIVGEVLFAFGLLAIVHYKLPLYTGMAGFFDWREIDEWLLLLSTIFVNACGCLFAASLIGLDGGDIIFSRIEAGYFLCLTRSIMCGIIMTFVVGAARQGNPLPLLLGIPSFIACGFYHSIADAFYMFSTLADFDLVKDYFPYWLVIVFGNFIGCNIPRMLNFE